jgi:kojibiose phosphorylase
MMKLENYTADREWVIEESSWEPNLQKVRETQFSQGNGYLGMRGILEEGPKESSPGTFITGIYDNRGAMVTELVNLPNPVYFRISVEGEKVGMAAMDILEHQRILDMSRGLLLRKTLYSTIQKQRFEYRSVRFLSMKDKHIGAMRIYFTSLDNPVTITVHNDVEYPMINRGVLTEGDKIHYSVREVSDVRNGNYLCFETFERNHLISYATHLNIARKSNDHSTKKKDFRLRLRKGETVCFTRIFSIHDSRSIDHPQEEQKEITVKNLQNCVKKGFDALLEESTKAWKKLWDSANVEIDGDPQIEKDLRFNIYHLLINGNEHIDASIGARGLSGEAYRGHVFWDTEIFILPFFVHTSPEIARNLLLYRYNRLDAARERAVQMGYKGALFPWESADTGEDVTPLWHRDLDKRVIKIHTMEQEQHIVADIAYATHYYYKATGDKEFLCDYGAEIIFETARFWASRVEYNEIKKWYEIKNVMGPDEFHRGVNNNAYTNWMAKWNLETAVILLKLLETKYPDRSDRLKAKIGLKDSEVQRWQPISEKIRIPVSDEGEDEGEVRGIIEEFDGYLKKKDIKLKEVGENFTYLPPAGLSVRDFGKTQLVKQADVVMLLHLLRDRFNSSTRIKNYEYYKKRTLHSSSLSPSIYSITAIGVGRPGEAMSYFLQALHADLWNLHGNTSDGIHIASAGGVWQAFMHGFMGIRINDIISLDPRFPQNWNEVKFKIKWQGVDMAVSAYPDRMKIFYESKKVQKLKVKVYGRIQELSAGKSLVIKKR